MTLIKNLGRHSSWLGGSRFLPVRAFLIIITKGWLRLGVLNVHSTSGKINSSCRPFRSSSLHRLFLLNLMSIARSIPLFELILCILWMLMYSPVDKIKSMISWHVEEVDAALEPRGNRSHQVGGPESCFDIWIPRLSPQIAMESPLWPLPVLFWVMGERRGERGEEVTVTGWVTGICCSADRNRCHRVSLSPWTFLP
jgi:hypothetical protein